MNTTTIDPSKLEAFTGQVLQDLGATWSAALVLMGDKLGLYKAMAGAGPLTADELARRSGCDARYVREWLNAQAAGGYVTYDSGQGAYTLPPEQAAVLADEDGPAFMVGGFEVALSAAKSEDRLCDAFRSGEGVGWHEHDCGLFRGTARFFKPSYVASLVDEWLPALDGVTEKLAGGGKVADVGCGHGLSTILMAKALPNTSFVGFDYHEGSIEAAREEAKKAGVADRVTFERARAQDYPGGDYDLVTCFDCLHDMGDPVGAAAHVRSSLAQDGTCMLVEPFAGDAFEDNHNPVGRVYYAASTLVCTPASKSQEVGLALGAQAGFKRLNEVLGQGGFTRVRKAAETPFNLILEARP